MDHILQRIKALRIYWFAVAFYSLVGLAIGMPILSHHRVEAAVQKQLAVVKQQAAMHQPAYTPTATTGHPVMFTIARLHINLQVADGHYDAATRSWKLDSQHIFVDELTNSHPVISTSTTVQPMMTVFYGHEIPSVVGNTNNLVKGDLLTITTDTGYRFTYYFTGDAVVSPNTTGILAMVNKTPQVALITCSGPFSQARRIMYFQPVGSPEPVIAQGSTP